MPRKTQLRFFALVLLLIASGLTWSGQKLASSSSSKPVHVREYTRKDGTVVHAHERAMPGTGSASATTATTTPAAPKSPTPVAPAGPSPVSVSNSADVIARDSHGRIKCSEAAKHQFQ